MNSEPSRAKSKTSPKKRSTPKPREVPTPPVEKNEIFNPIPTPVSTVRPGHELIRLSVDFPAWVVEALEEEAQKIGITKQSIIKLWIAEKVKYSYIGSSGADDVPF